MFYSRKTSQYIRRKILEMGATEVGTAPEDLAQILLTTLSDRKPASQQAADVQRTTHDRNIVSILHFTPLRNLENILLFGLLPREYLENWEILKLVSAPIFPDTERKDKKIDCFCVSISWPNYKMLHSKMLKGPLSTEKWVIIEFESEILEQLDFSFYRTNAAKRESVKRGADQFGDLFYDKGLRKKLGIDREFTTDPEAECMSRGRISPEQIKAIYHKLPYGSFDKTTDRLFKDLSKKKLLKPGILKQNQMLFEARKDYKFWQ